MDSQLEASYRAAEAVARQRARNFYYSFVVLPPVKKRALCAVYSFMRFCDDISDGEDSVGRKRELLKRWRSQLDAATGGQSQGSAILPAFRDTMHRFSIPPEYFHLIIDGAEMDLAISRYESFEDLYRYCFRVASAVGLVCIQIFGYSDDRARKHAEECGIAFQLTNILRDIQEDARIGRIYLPAEDLRRFRYEPDELPRGVYDDRFIGLMRYEADRVRGYYARAQSLLPLIEPACRPCLWAMMEIYGRLFKKIEGRRYRVFGGSIHLSGAEKAGIVFRALAMRIFGAQRTRAASRVQPEA